MSTMKDLLGCIDALSAHAQGILEEAENLRKLYSTPEPAKPRDYTLAEVRSVLAQKSADGFRKEVKAILLSHGVEKLTDVNPCDYWAIIEEAEALNHAS